MATWVQPTSSFSRQKCGKEGIFLKDRISALPDEILLSVLCRFTVKEAAKTSILSQRWEKLWTFISSLKFDNSETLANSVYRPGCTSERLKFARWVNHALKSHQSPIIEEFRICFDLNNISTNDIDSWISFATKKRVQRLELDLSNQREGHMRNRFKISWQPFGFDSFETLSTLRMMEVDISDEVLEHILSNSPVLEHLYVYESHSLVNVKVSCPSLNLKYLEIHRCYKLKSIEISAIHLVSFKYCGRIRISLHFKNVPQLAEVSFGSFGHPVIDISHQLSSYLSQIKKLTLTFNTECKLFPPCPQEFPKWPTLSNLRHLKLIVFARGRLRIHPIISVLEASPFIHIIKLQFTLLYMGLPERKAPKFTKKHPYEYLKVVELLGFVGDTDDLEIAMYLLENAVSLEKLTIGLFEPECRIYPCEIREGEKQLTRECAIQLGTKLPPGAEFFML